MVEYSGDRPKLEVDDIALGIEMSLATQEDVVTEFNRVVELDLGEGAARYQEFAAKLERAASGGNAQIRSMIGGPDSISRAGLIGVLAGRYSTASLEVKEMIVDVAMKQLLHDSYFYVRMAVTQMSNPYLIGDIIREFPLANPGADYYEEDLLKSGSINDEQQLQSWLDKFGGNFFAATTIALQKGDEEEIINNVIVRNDPVFQGAAHITAATHDVFAEIKILRGDARTKDEITEHYRSSFVSMFAEMIGRESKEANWTPLRRMPLEFKS